MSVRKCDRNEGKLQVLNLSLNLAVYTLQICHNEKVFPKSQPFLANAARGNAYRQCAKIKRYYKELTGRDYE